MSTLFDLTLPRCHALHTSVIFSDESSQQAIHFCVFGGLYFWCPNEECKSEITKLESGLAARAYRRSGFLLERRRSFCWRSLLGGV